MHRSKVHISRSPMHHFFVMELSLMKARQSIFTIISKIFTLKLCFIISYILKLAFTKFEMKGDLLNYCFKVNSYINPPCTSCIFYMGDFQWFFTP